MMLFEASPYRTKIVAPGVHFVESNHFDEVIIEAHGVQVVYYDYLDTTVALLDPDMTTVMLA